LPDAREGSRARGAPLISFPSPGIPLSTIASQPLALANDQPATSGSATARAPARSPALAVTDNAAVVIETLQCSTDLDTVIFAEDSCYDLRLDEQRALRHKFITQAFAWHVERCEIYRRFVERQGVSPHREPELDAVPVFPTGIFKTRPPLSIAEADVEKWCLSSGTLGRRSLVPRDRISLERLLGSVKAAMPMLTDWHEHEVNVINLGPDRGEAGDVWFAYVMSLVELLYPTRCRVQQGVFECGEAVTDIQEHLAAGREAMLIGPPFLVLEVIRRVQDLGLRIAAGDRLTVVTAGGWKRHTGIAIPRAEFSEQVGRAFGLQTVTPVRDAFNQVELNTVFLECAAHRKHIPPWVHAVTRDAQTLRALPHGEVGLLSYLDASAQSYPCFIVAEDLGVVRELTCECGREGTVIEVLRRVHGTIQRGCALTMDQTLERRRHAER
jgi:long-chain-fatty-acid---luciferin-component ligase